MYYIKKVCICYEPESQFTKPIGVEVKKEDAIRLGLKAYIDIQDIDGLENRSAWVEDLEEILGVQMKTQMIQPGGRQPLNSGFFRLLQQKVRETNGTLVVMSAYTSDENDENKEFLAVF